MASYWIQLALISSPFTYHSPLFSAILSIVIWSKGEHYGIKKTFWISWERTLGPHSPLPRPGRLLACHWKTREEINEFVRNYKGNLHTFEDFEAAFAVFEQIQIQLSHIGNYSFMPQTTDFGDEAFAEIAQAGMDFETWASVELSFFDDALVEADEDVLERLGQLPHLTFAIRQAKIKKAHYLGADVEKTLTNLGEVFYGPQDIYTKMRAGDFEMADFEVDGKVYKNSFVTYENFYQNHENAEIREKAFRSFSEGLRKYQTRLLLPI